MDKNTNKPQQNRSMFLYTALIFLVALILIIIAAFGNTNINNLRRNAEQIPTTEEATEAADDELAVLANSLSSLQAENERLSDELGTYTALIDAYVFIQSDRLDEAETAIANISPDLLSESQLILYNQITETINERKDK